MIAPPCCSLPHLMGSPSWGWTFSCPSSAFKMCLHTGQTDCLSDRCRPCPGGICVWCALTAFLSISAHGAHVSYSGDDADRAPWVWLPQELCQGGVCRDGSLTPPVVHLEGPLGPTASSCCQKGQMCVIACPPGAEASPLTDSGQGCVVLAST